tara:strand:+ start:1043 stop:1198 length:156 start_codon:yes stop_codon:yes gene_type:complete
MYSLKCTYYDKEFNTIRELIKDIMERGMDPSYEITKNGKGIGEEALDFITY